MPPVPTSDAFDPLPRWKRALDLLAVLIALPLLGVCCLAMLCLTRWQSPGPLFFRQQRIGFRGRPFELLKFRTMHHAASVEPHRDYVVRLVQSDVPMAKLDQGHDPRLIRGSWLLRASGFDELPQMLNVLRGDMSLVGPRPCLPYEYEQHNAVQRGRFNVRPGLTGLWQVSGKNRTTFQTMIDLDLRYARELSLLQDLKIIALTFPTLGRQVLEGLNHRLHRPASTSPSLPAAATSTPARRAPFARNSPPTLPVS